MTVAHEGGRFHGYGAGNCSCALRAFFLPSGNATSLVEPPGLHAAKIGDKDLYNDWVRTEPDDRSAIAVIPLAADRQTAVSCDFANVVGATSSKPSFAISSNGAGSQQGKIARILPPRETYAAIMGTEMSSNGP